MTAVTRAQVVETDWYDVTMWGTVTAPCRAVLDGDFDARVIFDDDPEWAMLVRAGEVEVVA